MVLIAVVSCHIVKVYYKMIFIAKSLMHILFYAAECLDSEGNPISGDPFEKENDCDHFYQVENLLEKFSLNFN